MNGIVKLLKNKRIFDEKGFSLLELVVAVGVLLVLTVAGLLAYNGITDNARQAATQKAADEVYDSAMSKYSGGDNGNPETVDDEWNKSAGEDSNIVTEMERLDNGQYKVTATYGNGEHTATRTTPLSNSDSDSGFDTTLPLNNVKCGTSHELVCEIFKLRLKALDFESKPSSLRIQYLMTKGTPLSEEDKAEWTKILTDGNSIGNEMNNYEELIENNNKAKEDYSIRNERRNDPDIASSIQITVELYQDETYNVDSSGNYKDPEKVNRLYNDYINDYVEYINAILE